MKDLKLKIRDAYLLKTLWKLLTKPSELVWWLRSSWMQYHLTSSQEIKFSSLVSLLFQVFSQEYFLLYFFPLKFQTSPPPPKISALSPFSYLFLTLSYLSKLTRLSLFLFSPYKYLYASFFGSKISQARTSCREGKVWDHHCLKCQILH